MSFGLGQMFELTNIYKDIGNIKILLKEQNKILSDISEALKRNNTLNSIAIEDEYLRNRGDL